ncbi:DUF3140 domain-containing protein [Actinomadura violacea]|uniref:DUF3140 domain-containing protein n=1 Tax=Actinomadura violacea TaxID=2819934 RepID=A0ABS3RLK3_9ACTN|nr:DUF3140 domain-containing protein [Actinomadura violacea]MBO2457621.1 DUF3140 domain-containing protein [Actinomadura violacea]
MGSERGADHRAGRDAAAARDAVASEFGAAVNMTPKELEDWLDTDESRSAGQRRNGGESTGHASGRRIVELMRAKRADLSDQDYDHMNKVVGYVRRHLAQRPSGDVKDTKWRHSLMNWGHDPLK